MEKQKMPETLERLGMPEENYWPMRFLALADRNDPGSAEEARQREIPANQLERIRQMKPAELAMCARKARMFLRPPNKKTA